MTAVYEYTFTRRHVRDVAFRDASSPAHIVNAVAPVFSGAETERLVVAALDARNHILGYEFVYVGNVSAALVRVGELFRFPIRVNASSMIMLHNHPTGNTTPSPDDLVLTANAVDAGKLLDIPVLDHIIVSNWAGEPFVSLSDQGVVPRP